MILDEQFNLKEDKLYQLNQDANIEMEMHRNDIFCLEQLGIDNIHVMIEEIAIRAMKYGHEVSIEDVIEHLKEM